MNNRCHSLPSYHQFSDIVIFGFSLSLFSPGLPASPLIRRTRAIGILAVERCVVFTVVCH